MLSRCLSCYRPFPANESFERVPLGSRIVFDPALGRLWSVCPACARWTLQPMEERWEALEDLERAIRDGARLLGSTDHIALYESRHVEVVRVGDATGREQAWWRYGREFAARQARARRAVRTGRIIGTLESMLLVGVPLPLLSSPGRSMDRARRARFGRHAWRGELRCDRCGSQVSAIRFSESGGLTVALNAAGATVLRYACRRCGGEASGGYELRGTSAEHVLRRVLAYRNFAGADADAVDTAMHIVEQWNSVHALIESIPDRRLLLGSDARLPRLQLGMPDATLPLEILLNAELERQQLTRDLAAIEARWRNEERLAAIIDRELTPLPTASR